MAAAAALCKYRVSPSSGSPCSMRRMPSIRLCVSLTKSMGSALQVPHQGQHQQLSCTLLAWDGQQQGWLTLSPFSYKGADVALGVTWANHHCASRSTESKKAAVADHRQACALCISQRHCSARYLVTLTLTLVSSL